MTPHVNVSSTSESVVWPRIRVVAAVARIASAPVEVVSAFARPELAEAARAATSADQLTQSHMKALEHQRRVLRSLAGTEEFQRALAFAAPELVDRWRSLPDPAVARRARHRRLEASVFRYLHRAAGRSTPQGPWAGVVEVEVDPSASGIIARCVPGRAVVSVDLGVVAPMVDALRLERRYRRRYPVRLRPLASPEAEASVSGIGLQQIAWPRFVEAVKLHFGDGRCEPIEPLLDAIVQAHGDPPGLAQSLDVAADALFAAGILESALHVPATATTADETVRLVIAQLEAEDRTVWERAFARIRVLLAALCNPDLPACDVARCMRRVTDLLDELWQSSGLPAPMPGRVVAVDHGAPWSVVVGESEWQRICQATDALLRFHSADGSAECYRRWTFEDMVAGRSPGVSLHSLAAASRSVGSASPHLPFGREDVFGRFRPAFDRRAWLEASTTVWELRLGPVASEHAVFLDVPAAFDGTSNPSGRTTNPAEGVSALPGIGGDLLLSLSGDGRVWLGPARPQPGLFSTRLSALLADHPHKLRQEIPRAPGLEVADVLGADPSARGAALRPVITPAVIEATNPGRLWVEWAQDERPVLRDGDGRRLVPIYASGAAVGRSDPVSRVLLGLALAHGWEYPSYGVPPLPAEIESWHHLPRIALDDHTVLSPERWTIPVEEARDIAVDNGPGRYLRWRRAVDRARVPELALVSMDPQRTPLLIATSSPLAVDVLFSSPRAGSSPIVLTELPGDPTCWPVVGADGGHHLLELGVTWFDPDYLQRLGRVNPTGPVDPDVAAERTGSYPGTVAGSEWLQRNLAVPGPLSRSDPVIVEVAAFMARMHRDGSAAGWWFVRKEPGLKIRIRTKAGADGDADLFEAGARVDSFLADLVRAGLIRGFLSAVYEPEWDRFGGEHGTQLAHEHFAEMSSFTAACLRIAAERPEPHRWLGALVMACTQDLLWSCLDDRGEVEDAWRRLASAIGVDQPTTGSDPGRSPMPGSALDLGHLAEAGDVKADGGNAALQVPGSLVPAVEAIRSHHASLGHAIRRAELHVGRRAFLATLAVFDWNRFGLTTVELCPLVVRALGRMGSRND